MKIVPYRDTDDGQLKKALLPQTQEEGALIERAIMQLMLDPPTDLSKEDVEDLARMAEIIENSARVNPVALAS